MCSFVKQKKRHFVVKSVKCLFTSVSFGRKANDFFKDRTCLTSFKRQLPMWRLNKVASLRRYVGICNHIQAFSFLFFPLLGLKATFFSTVLILFIGYDNTLS